MFAPANKVVNMVSIVTMLNCLTTHKGAAMSREQRSTSDSDTPMPISNGATNNSCSSSTRCKLKAADSVLADTTNGMALVGVYPRMYANRSGTMR